MTTPDLTAEGAVPETPAPPDTEPDRERRRRKFLLFFLFGLLAIFLLLATWYLLFRKPFTELPIPVVPTVEVPTYQYSIHEVDGPNGVAASADGSRIYVATTGGSLETLMFDGKGNKLGVLKPPDDLVTGRASQFGVAVDPIGGEVYATDRTNSKVFVYRADGTYDRLFDPGPEYAGWQPLAISFDPQGNLYISDVGGAFHVVHEFGRDGKLIRDLGQEGTFDYPNGIAFDKNGYIYVVDTNHGRLVVLDAAGNQRATVERGSAQGNLGLPRGVVVDDRGRVLVVDTSGQHVQVYRAITEEDTRSPLFLAAFGSEGTGNGAFEYPRGVTVDARGRVYVADWSNDRIEVWSY